MPLSGTLGADRDVEQAAASESIAGATRQELGQEDEVGSCNNSQKWLQEDSKQEDPDNCESLVGDGRAQSGTDDCPQHKRHD